jgi:hypothetical protein
MSQWHPIFAQLLRPAIDAYYEMETTFPVGDAPREADFVLLRRLLATPAPFHGLWRNLTTWNVLEYKGPTVAPRRGHLESLVEVGLGVDRKLRTGRDAGRRGLGAEEMSFWYLANHLGRRFLREAERLLGGLEPLGTGLWRSRVLGRLVFLASSIDLPVEADSLPLHIVGQEPAGTERAVAQLVAAQPKFQQQYGGWMATLHPRAWEEIDAMVRRAGKSPKIDLRPAIELLGLDHVLEQVGTKRVVEAIGPKRFVEAIGLENLLASLSPAERRELKQRLQRFRALDVSGRLMSVPSPNELTAPRMPPAWPLSSRLIPVGGPTLLATRADCPPARA